MSVFFFFVMSISYVFFLHFIMYFDDLNLADLVLSRMRVFNTCVGYIWVIYFLSLHIINGIRSKGHDLKCPSEGHRWLVPVQERLPSDWQTVTTCLVKSCGNCLLPHICGTNPDFWDIITILWNGCLVSNTSRM